VPTEGGRIEPTTTGRIQPIFACVVARSDEAKAAGVEMGVPLFEIKDLVKRAGIEVFSSNYALYGDISGRVTDVLREHAPRLEVYSIDESFAEVTGIPDVPGWAFHVRARILQEVGMPVCVGVARTKTLAKAANRVAKKFKARTGGVHVIDTDELEEKALRWLAVEDVWGIGPALNRRLTGYGIRTAWDLVQRPEAWVRRTFGVVLTRTWQELRGVSCLDLCEVEPERQSIRTSRSFEKDLYALDALEAAVATFASRTAAKLRERGLSATALSVFMYTNRFREQDPQYSGHRTGALTVPTNNVTEIVAISLKLARLAWREGYGYKKAGVEALHLVPQGVTQANLFDTSDRERLESLQRSMDLLTRRWGPETVTLAVQGTRRAWTLRREHMSQRYSTAWSELLRIDMDRCYSDHGRGC
jgi:DNA polymerase V